MSSTETGPGNVEVPALSAGSRLAARGKSPAAVGQRCIPPRAALDIVHDGSKSLGLLAPRTWLGPAAASPKVALGTTQDSCHGRLGRIALWATLAILVHPLSASAYVGPGAGFAFVSSLFIVITTLALAIVTLLTWPLRWVIQKVRGNRALAAARVRRVIVLGLDGQESGDHRAADEREPAAQFRPAARPGIVSTPPYDAAGRVAGGLGLVPDRLQPRETSNLRLPRAEPEEPPARVVLGPHRPAAPHPAAGPLPHPARPTGDSVAAPEPTLLEDPRRARHLQHDPASADHVSPGAVQRGSCSRR